ncbi:MAG: hypothetical protein A4S09_10955 [Proteobacteria bacterium SG_bin7]|nr:MAG: hypothetical protein A4S09_10955 [Proteobacteria bacterium SG_bin7]
MWQMSRCKIIVHFFTIVFSLPSLAKVIYVSDLDGRNDGIMAQIEAGNLRMTRDGHLDFVDSKDSFVFGGNVTGRGTKSVRMRELLMEFKDRYAGKVKLVVGKEDLRRLSILGDLKSWQNLTNSDYASWLQKKVKSQGIDLPKKSNELWKKLQGQNSRGRQLEYWAEKQKSPDILENHRRELEEIRRKPVSMEVAVEDFIRGTQPGGEYFQFLERSQIVAIDENAIFIRGGVREKNMGSIPESKSQYSNARDWAPKLNEWYHKKLKGMRDGNLKGEPSRHLVQYGDSLSIAPPSTEVSSYLSLSGIQTEVIGQHDNQTTVLRNKSLRFAGGGDKKAITVRNGEINIATTTASGKPIEYKVSPRSSEVVGKVANGYVIEGQDSSGNYILEKRLGGLVIDKREVTPTVLQQQYRIQSMSAPNGEGALTFINKVPVLGIEDLGGGRFGKKAPLIISASSLDTKNEESVKNSLRKLADSLDPAKVIIVTDSTSRGIAQIAHEVFQKKGFDVVGFAKETSADKINRNLNGVVLIGQENPQKLGLTYARAQRGSVISIGSDGSVKQDIEKTHPEWLKSEVQNERLNAAIRNGKIKGKVVGYSELLEQSAGSKVTVIGGFSEVDYQNPAAVKSYIKELMRANGDNAMYVLEGTSKGIGEAHQWIPQIAKELGYKHIKTAGIYSGNIAESGPVKQDFIVLNSQGKENAMPANIAEASGGKMIFFGGDSSATSQIATAVLMGVPVTVVNDRKIAPNESDVKKVLAENPGTVIDGTKKFARGSFEALKETTTPSGLAAVVKEIQVASRGAEAKETYRENNGLGAPHAPVLPAISQRETLVTSTVPAPAPTANSTFDGKPIVHEGEVKKINNYSDKDGVHVFSPESKSGETSIKGSTKTPVNEISGSSTVQKSSPDFVVDKAPTVAKPSSVVPSVGSTVSEKIDQSRVEPKIGTTNQVKDDFAKRGKDVVSFVGTVNSEQARDIFGRYDPKKTIINAGPYSDDLLREARRMGFETTQVISSQNKGKKIISPYADSAYVVRDGGGKSKKTQQLTTTSHTIVAVSKEIVAANEKQTDVLKVARQGEKVVTVLSRPKTTEIPKAQNIVDLKAYQIPQSYPTVVDPGCVDSVMKALIR